MTFEYWKRLSDSQTLMEFSQNPEGLMWLKVKSITRVEWMRKFLEFAKIHLQSSRIYECQKELFGFFQNKLEEAHTVLDAFFQMEFERFQGTQTSNLETHFSYKGKQYATLADAVFLIK